MDIIQEEIMILNMGSNDISYIAKGKRTKRQRLQSPMVLALTNTTTSNSTNTSDGDDNGGNVENGDDNNQIIMNNSSVSPTSSTTTGFITSQEDQEDEDMANCLILLAKGGHGNKRSIQHQEEEDEDFIIPTATTTTTTNLMEVVVPRFNSRRITETPIIGKSGFYVYECKTCNRCFPSFQALGGHRASHKKPKNLLMAEDHQQRQFKKSLVLLSETQIPVSRVTTTTSSPMGFNNNNNNNKSKFHECSICGTEFSSGQALGGHMRRHRTTPTTAATAATTTNSSAISAIINHNTTTKNTITSMSGTQEFHRSKMQKTRNLLSLDLNLPAPQEDDQQGKFTFGSNSKQQSLVFSASPLVDCHY